MVNASFMSAVAENVIQVRQAAPPSPAFGLYYQIFKDNLNKNTLKRHSTLMSPVLMSGITSKRGLDIDFGEFLPRDSTHSAVMPHVVCPSVCP